MNCLKKLLIILLKRNSFFKTKLNKIAVFESNKNTLNPVKTSLQRRKRGDVTGSRKKTFPKRKKRYPPDLTHTKNVYADLSAHGLRSQKLSESSFYIVIIEIKV